MARHGLDRGERVARAELDDAHRGQRRQIMGIERFEKAVGQFGKLVVQLLTDAGGRIGETLDQAFHMRVVGDVAGHAQAAGDLREGIGKARGPAAERQQFLIVTVQETFSHAPPPRGSAGSRDRSSTQS